MEGDSMSMHAFFGVKELTLKSIHAEILGKSMSFDLTDFPNSLKFHVTLQKTN